MLAELKFTLRFSDHIRDVTLKHFELRYPHLAHELRDDDFSTYRAYYKDLLVDKPSYAELTEHQQYLHDLSGVIAPAIASYRMKTRIPRLRPRTRSITASAKFEECGQRLSFEAYHFKERLKLISRSTGALILEKCVEAEFGKRMGKVILDFERLNQRLLKYRNFVVHGPANRVDEFAELRSWEIGGIFHHPDLWFDYNSAFWEAQQDWSNLAKSLILSMEAAIFQVQTLNERLIEDQALDFTSANIAKVKAATFGINL